MRRNVMAVLICAALMELVTQLVAQRSGRGSEEPAGPTPRFADGTPNLGRAPGEQGVWGVPWIRNMGLRIDKADAANDLAASRGRGGLIGHIPGRDGSRFEPRVPFMPWSAAVYDYHVANESKYDPEGYCLPPGGPRMMATPYPMEIIPLPEQKRIIMTFEGATHVWREIYMDGRAHPQGDALNPTYLGHSIGRWEGDTLVVDVVGFNEATWIDYSGIRTPTCCTSWRSSHGPTRTRCTTKRRSTIPARTRSRGPSRGTSLGARTRSCLNTSARRTTST